MSIRARLVGGASLVLLGVLALAIVASVQVERLANIADEVATGSMKRIDYMSHMNTNLVQWRGLSLTLLLSDNPQSKEKDLGQLNELVTDIEKLVRQYDEVIHDPVRRADYEAFLQHVEDYLIVHRRLVTFIREGEIAAGAALFANSQERFDKMLFHIGRIQGDEMQSAREASLAAATMVARTRFLFLLGALVTVAILVSVGFYVWRSLSAGLERLIVGTRRVAQGDLSQPVTPVGRDEFAFLATKFNAMIHSLKQSKEEIQRLTQEALNLQEERINLLHNQLSLVVTAQEEERKRIARELHDDTAQALVTLADCFDHLLSRLTRLPKGSQSQLREMRELTNGTLEGVRRFSRDLRPSVIDDLGVIPAIQWLAERSSSDQSIRVRVEVVGDPHRPPADMELSLFRIVQEALQNIGKHARAREASVRVNFSPGKISIAISDNGRGFVVPTSLGEITLRGHLGILGMQERARLLGGKLEIRSQPGQGTTVLVEVPCEKDPTLN